MSSAVVIGGGIAGLSCAVFLCEEGFEVTLIESSPKLGGRAYSFFDREKEMFFDNGQHILAGWYENTFEYLKIIGSYGMLNFQSRLEVNFIDTQKKVYRLRCTDDRAPVNLLKGLLKYNALNFRDKLALISIRTLLNGDDDFAKKYSNVRELLKGIKQTENLLKFFWEPLILAVFNARAEKVDVNIFLNVIRRGFNAEVNSTLVIPEKNLNEIVVDPAREYFKSRNVIVVTGNGVDRVHFNGSKCEYVQLNDGKKISGEYFVSAVPFFAYKKLFEGMVYEENHFRSELLKSSAIVSVHLFFEERIPEELIPDNSYGMTGLIGTIVQWIFKRGENHLSLVISGADDLQITGMNDKEILDLCIGDLSKTIEGFSRLKLSDHKVIKEKRATFVPDYASNEFRQSQKTKYQNFFVAGDWTDTMLPSTIEGAVFSAKKCVGLIKN